MSVYIQTTLNLLNRGYCTIIDSPSCCTNGPQLCRLSLPCRDHVLCLVRITYHTGFAAILLETATVLATTAAVLPGAGGCAAAAVPCHGTRPLYRPTCRCPATSPKCGYSAISMDLLFSCVQCTSNKYCDQHNKITRKLFNCM